MEGKHMAHTGITWLGVPALLLPLCLILSCPLSGTCVRPSRLPNQILMTTVIRVSDPPVRLEMLSVRWEHDGRPLVEYKEGTVITHNPRALMPQEQFKDGNVSLVLTHLTPSDSGNYTCVIHYGAQAEMVQYTLMVEKHRIQLLTWAPDPEPTGLSEAQQQDTGSAGAFLHIAGNPIVNARPGENVTLPCIFKTNLQFELAKLTLQWSKDGVTKLFLNKTCCGSRKPSMDEQDLYKGHASLQLRNVQREDAGSYSCYIKYKMLEKSLETTLRVQDATAVTGGSPKRRRTKMAGNVQMRASTRGATPCDVEVDDVSDSRLEQEPDEKHRTLKVGLVFGVVAVTGSLAFVIFFCFAG